MTVTDGRVARAERTRHAVIEAHIALIEAGELKPTGAQIAARAGVSLRALWANFNDLETLFAETGAELLRRQDSAFAPVPVDLPLGERIDAFCRQRAELLELMAPFARSSAMRAPQSERIRRNKLRHIARVVEEVDALFAAELTALDPSHRGRLVRSVAVASTWGSWVALRDVLGLPVAEATELMKHTVTALLSEAGSPALSEARPPALSEARPPALSEAGPPALSEAHPSEARRPASC